MNNLLKGEFFKLRHSIGFRVLMIIAAVFGIIEFLSFAYGEVFGNSINMTGYDAFYSQFSDLRELVFIFVGAFTGIFIGEDFACRTFQAEIASGNSRFKVLLSKTLVYMLGICMIILVQLLIVTAGAILVNGFGERVAISLIGNMVRAGLMFMFHICSCSMLCVFTAIILKNKASILAVNFLILALIDGLFQLITSIHNEFLNIYKMTPFLQSILSTSSTISASELIKSCFIGIVTIISIYLVTFIAFKKAELK